MAGRCSGMPDLQLRMSKKIAQLTKVIYHLNNRNEDHDIDMQELAEQYEMEMELMLKDTADKAETWKRMMEAARDETQLQRIHEQLESKYEAEKQRCIQELENLRKKSADKEAAIQKTASRQIDQLSMQVDQLQEQLQSRIKEINELGSNANASAQDLQEMLMKAKHETEEAIQSGNKKYNDMIAERMRIEDQLNEQIQELTRRLEMESAGRQEALKTLGDERARWEEERARLLEEARKSDEAWKSKSDRLVDELTREKGAAREAAKEASQRERDAGIKISDLESLLSKTQADLQNSLQGTERLTRDLEALGASSAGQAQQLQAQLEEACQQIRSLEGKLAEEQSKAERAAADAAADVTGLSAEIAANLKALQESQALVSSLRKELDQRGADVAARDRSIEDLQQQLDTLLSKHEKSCNEYKAKITNLESELRSAVQSGQSDAQSATRMAKEEMERRLAEAEEAKRKALQAAQQEAASKLAAAEESAAARLEDAAKDASARLADAKAKAAASLAELEERLQQQMEELRERLEREKQAALGELNNSRLKDVGAAESAMLELKSQIQQLQQQLDAERQGRSESDAEVARLNGMLENQGRSAEANQGALESRVKNLEEGIAKLERERDELRLKVEYLLKEMDALQQKAQNDLAAAQQSHAAVVSELNNEWTAKCAQSVRDAVEKKQQELMAEMEALRESLLSAGGSEREALMAKLQQEMAAQKEAAAAEIGALKKQHDEEVEAERRKAADAIAEAQRVAKEQLEAAQASANAQLGSSEAQLKATMDKALHDEREKAEAERQKAAKAAEEMQERHAREMEAMQRKMKSESEAASALLAQTVTDWTAKLEAELAKAKNSSDNAHKTAAAAHSAELEKLRGEAAAAEAKHAAAVAALEKQLAAMTKIKEGLEASKCELDAKVQELQANLVKKASEMSDAIFNMKQEHRDEKEGLLKSYREDKELLMSQHANDTREMKDQFDAALARADEQYAELAEKYAQAKATLDAREPREEDVLRIRQLEAALDEAAERVRSAEERMVKLRAELLQREETYNKTFKNGGKGEKVLNVGQAMNSDASVMDWMLKDKKKGQRAGSGKMGAGPAF